MLIGIVLRVFMLMKNIISYYFKRSIFYLYVCGGMQACMGAYTYVLKEVMLGH